MLPTINMRLSGENIPGQGVGSAGREQINLVKDALSHKYNVVEYHPAKTEITHFHTIEPGNYMSISRAKHHGRAIGYVHMLPETVDESLRMPKLFRWFFYKYMMSFYRRMDALVVVNPYFIERLAAYNIPTEKVTYIPNFVSEEQFHPISDDEIVDIRKSFGIEEDAFVLLGVGQLQTRKGILDFIQLANDMPHITFAWAGGFSFGPITAGYDEIKKAMKSPPDNLKFLGLVPREDMNNLYNMCDVMFLPSYEELFPMAILESMNCYKPLLLRDIDLYKNILFDFYLRADSLDGFKAEIEKLSTDKNYYDDASAKSKEGHNFYSREHVSKMWENFYDAQYIKIGKGH